MSDIGYRTFLELGFTDQKKGNFVSFGDALIELDVCGYSFIRSIDERGKIQTDLRGGNISFAFSGLPSLAFLDWCTNSNKYYSGYIHIKDLHGEPKERIFFEDAACVNMKISYINDGTSYVMVQGLLQAVLIQLQGAKPLYNYWNNENMRNSSRISTKDAKQALINRIVLNPDVSLNVSMILGKDVYPLRSFEIEFNQDVDYKGEPQSEVSGGIASVALYSLPDENLNKWLRNGEGENVRFLFGDDLVGYPLSMDFKNACCLGYFVEVQNYSEDSINAKLNIIPQSIDFGNGIQFKAPYQY